jgi:predicted ATPase with chaperone activity
MTLIVAIALLRQLIYLGPPEKGKSTAAQLVSAIETR